MKPITSAVIVIVIGFAIAGVATPANDSIKDQIVAKEREELDALKAGQIDVFASLLADEAIFLNSRGPAPKAQVVKNVGNFKLLDYSMEDVQFVPVGPRTGLIVYKLTEQIGRGDKDFMATFYVSALWTERQGKWLCLFSQESPAK